MLLRTKIIIWSNRLESKERVFNWRITRPKHEMLMEFDSYVASLALLTHFCHCHEWLIQFSTQSNWTCNDDKECLLLVSPRCHRFHKSYSFWDPIVVLNHKNAFHPETCLLLGEGAAQRKSSRFPPSSPGFDAWKVDGENNRMLSNTKSQLLWLFELIQDLTQAVQNMLV